MDGIALDPVLPGWALAGLAAAALAVAAAGLRRRAAGTGWRVLAFAALLLGALRPTALDERRVPLADVVLVVADATASQRIGARAEETRAALDALREALAGIEAAEVRTVTETGGGREGGTRLFDAARAALSDVPPDGVAAVVLVTDGRVHDAPAGPAGPGLGAPVHALLTGRPGERDRRIRVAGVPRYGIVGDDVRLRVTVEDEGFEGEAVPLEVAVEGGAAETRILAVGEPLEVAFPLERAGLASLSLRVPEEEGELTHANNRSVVHVNAVRDRLRVMLVSGAPSMGLRQWRELLQADPAVDLVHFTVLRPPTKQDATPVQELSLIPFPARELFAANLDRFDLVIFDRYHLRGILPPQYLTNIVEYVVRGGALLDVAGPAYAGQLSLANTPLRTILPTLPAGEVIERAFVPALSETGRAHPVTEALARDAGGAWGPWYRIVPGMPVGGETLMRGPDNWPLLQVNRVGEGRVAQILSDQSWVWARAAGGRGPQADLLRRVVHWLMKEPDLEENALHASVDGGRIEVAYRSLEGAAGELRVTSPSGRTRALPIAPGARMGVDAPEPGLWRLEAGTLAASVLVGAADRLELADPRATPDLLRPAADASGGGIHWLADGVPEVRAAPPGAPASGPGWIGVRAGGRHVVAGVAEEPLAPWPLLLALAAGALFLAWHRESR